MLWLLMLAAAVAIYCVPLCHRFLQNLSNARRSGCSYIVVPWDQTNIAWELVSPNLRPTLKRCLPFWLYRRLSWTIHGSVFDEKGGVFDDFAAHQGDGSSYVLVTAGNYEFFTRDPEVAMETLRRLDDFVIADSTIDFMSCFGHNVLTVQGERWTRQRKIVATSLNQLSQESVFKESVQQTAKLLATIDGQTDHILDAMRRITINVLNETLLGSRIDVKAAHAEATSGFKLSYAQAIQAVMHAMTTGMIMIPSWVLHNYPSWLPGYETLQKQALAVREYPRHGERLLQDERQISASSAEDCNFVQRLLQAAQADNDVATSLPDSEVIGNLFLLTTAGFETTANTLSYALVMLVRHPEWQDWIIEELDELLPDYDQDDLEPSMMYSKATRIMACMFETLRFFPALPQLPKATKTAQSLKTSSRHYWFPPKASVYIDTVALHLDPKAWRNVNLGPEEKASQHDERHFRPSRWINHTEAPTMHYQPPKGAYIPWGGGPRICPGQRMSQIEFVAVLVTTFREFRLEAVPLMTMKGVHESRDELNARMDDIMQNSRSLLALQMVAIDSDSSKRYPGLTIKFITRR